MSMTFFYSLVQGAYWMQFAALCGFSSVFLLDCGFTSTAVGLVIALGGLIAAFLQPVLTSWADLPRSPSIKTITGVLALSGAAVTVLLLACYPQRTIPIGILYCSGYVLLLLLMPFINALGTENGTGGKKPNWGIARGFGSGAYGLVAFLLGRVTASRGAVAVPVCILIIFLMLLVFSMIYPYQKDQAAAAGSTARRPQKKEAEKAAPAGSFLQRHPFFLLLMAGMICLYLSHVLDTNFLYQVILHKGGSTVDNGQIMFLCAVLELPALFGYTLLRKKFSNEALYRTAGIFMALKAAAFFLAPNIPALYGAQIFQTLGWALISIVPVQYVKEHIPPQDAIKGQGYMAMTFTLGSAVGSLLGGALIDFAGITAMLIAAALTGILGAVTVIISIRNSV